jgi:DNA-binding beta-propeller fold protein YncE
MSSVAKTVVCFLATVSLGTLPGADQAADAAAPLVLERTILLAGVSGRIDHMAGDLPHKRLFVAELGNGSVDIVDLESGKVLHRTSGLREPQGVAYVPNADLFAVASAGDGTLRLFGGGDFLPRGVVKLGEDADNVRFDTRDGHLVVGYGSGGLAIVDPTTMKKLKDIPLPGHPESFQLSPSGDRAYVNVPAAHQIDVVDLASGTLIARWTLPHLASNFPMTLGDDGTVVVAFRAPARLVRFDAASGHMLAAIATCGDADDLFFDAKRQRYYVSCGAGVIDVIQLAGGGLSPLARIPTSSGARTSLFVPALDRLFLAVRAGRLESDASIQIFRPAS